MHGKTHAAPSASLDVRIGPLLYRFVAQDAPGEDSLQTLADNLQSSAPAGRDPDRTVMIENRRPFGTRPGWHHVSGPLGSLLYQDQAPTAVWSALTSPDQPHFRFPLPWNLLIADIARRQGVILHAGFTARNRKGLLFLAPPGGGKSTTLATATQGWEVLSDDAALVWPDTQGWWASPLPSWTTMTTPAAPADGRWRFDLGRHERVSGLLVLAKETEVSLVPMQPVDAVPHLYRACNEYPATALSAPSQKEHFFRCACRLGRGLPCWRLGLPRGGAIWPRLTSLAEELP